MQFFLIFPEVLKNKKYDQLDSCFHTSSRVCMHCHVFLSSWTS